MCISDITYHQVVHVEIAVVVALILLVLWEYLCLLTVYWNTVFCIICFFTLGVCWPNGVRAPSDEPR